MRVLVTGVSGFAGSFVARALAESGFDVVGVYRRETAFQMRIAAIPGIQFVRADVANLGALPGPIEAVVHVAATSPVVGVTTEQIVRDNVLSSLALTAEARKWQCRAFVLFSSVSLYGKINVSVLDELCPILDPDAYGETKHLGELLLAEAAASLPGLALRLPGVIGPGAHRNWLSGIAEKLRRGETIHAFNLDSPFNNAAHIADISDLVIKAINRGWRGFDTVVLGARGALSVREVIERLARGLKVKPQIVAKEPTKTSFTLSSQRAIERWGYNPMEIGAMIGRYAAEVLAGAR